MKQMQTVDDHTEKTSDPRPFKDWLTQPSLGRLVARARQILAIEKALPEVLPKELATHCQVLNIENGVLILASQSAAIITRLHYLSPEIIYFLNNQQGLSPINRISF